MPPIVTVKKQSPLPGKPTPKKSGSVWDRVADVPRDPGSIHVSVYGRSKTGKTRLLTTFPQPILIIGAEDGTKSILGAPGVKFVRITSVEECFELLDQVVQRGFKTVAIDTASALQDLILAQILGLKAIPEQKSWGTATRDQWGQCGLQTKTILAKALDLPINVVVIAHERNFGDDAPQNDMLVPAIGSALSPTTTAWLNGKVDYICQTYIREKEVVQEAKHAGQLIKRRVKNGEMEYCLRTGQHPVYMTGFRLPPGFFLPQMITDPSYEKILKIIKGEGKTV